ncbi:MAG: multicopper oxidase domain-containing protein [Acidobacteria bacterium]|nr:multicopper oxidase domain-containing protein [Acidobacteriota bacterium]
MLLTGITRASAACVTVLAVAASAAAQSTVVTPARAPTSVPVVARAAPNDNRTSAGQLRDGVLTLRLVATAVRWYPERDGPDDPVRPVQAFAEEGKPAQIPGPLVRVPEGTEVRVSVRNAIPDATLTLHGMATRPATSAAPVEIAPGATRELRFTAGVQGTYFYWGSTTGRTLPTRLDADSQLTGAFIVDPAGGAAAPDRVFVLTEYLDIAPGRPTYAMYGINGRSWPHTERLEMPFGEAATWRVINGTVGAHPMHLHGTFYTVESVGDGARDTAYGTAERRLVTTEEMLPGSTMMMRWVPDRVGKWLFHCHILAHVAGDMREVYRTTGAHPAAHDGDAHDMDKAMAGLVLGIDVLPGDETAAPDLAPHGARPLTLRLKSWPHRYGADAGYGFVIEDPRASTAAGTASAPVPATAADHSPTLVLHKDEPVAITLVNEMVDATSIHWHGIELESYHDGVAGWSGDLRQTTKLIQPQASLAVLFTPPRAGTFIYHTHGHDNRLLSSGLYAPLIVLPSGATFDPDTDKVILIGGSGPASSRFGPAPLEVNRSLNPPRMQLKVGVTYRFRLIDISPNYAAIVTLRGDSGPVQWRAVAKDGADLPPSQTTMRPARQRIAVGETYDFEFEPTEAGDFRIEVVRGGFAAPNAFVTSQLVRITQ